MKNVVVIVGTRPEAIKMGPVILALRAKKEICVTVCSTGQHRDMVANSLGIFNLTIDVDLDCMVSGKGLSYLTSRILCEVGDLIDRTQPDLILVHGDTATTLGASLAAFFNKVKIAHVEAGLRTGNLYSPWPEEANRVLVSRIASVHFAPTEIARENLLREGIIESNIIYTGNTVIDALQYVKSLIECDSDLRVQLRSDFLNLNFDRSIVLITTHRRDNFGNGLNSIIQAVQELASQNPAVQFVLPTHPNPQVKLPIEKALSNIHNIYLIKPQEYLSFVYLMMHASLILTDSGGIQEEAPSLGLPVVLMRDTTERPEAIDAGLVLMVGTDKSKIVERVNYLLRETVRVSALKNFQNPYGDGRAAEIIASWVVDNA
jgi:UDP-N-acetylglucosamine 2-epimerase (non-hydrolysing)